MTRLQRRGPLLEDPLVVARGVAIGGGESGAGAVDVLATLAHRSVDHAKTVGGVDARLETTGVLARGNRVFVDREGPAARRPPKGEVGLALGALRGAPHLELLAPARHHLAEVVGPEGSSTREEAHRLEERGLALGVLAEKDVQPRTQLHPLLLEVPDVA